MSGKNEIEKHMKRKKTRQIHHLAFSSNKNWPCSPSFPHNKTILTAIHPTTIASIAPPPETNTELKNLQPTTQSQLISNRINKKLTLFPEMQLIANSTILFTAQVFQIQRPRTRGFKPHSINETISGAKSQIKIILEIEFFQLDKTRRQILSAKNGKQVNLMVWFHYSRRQSVQQKHQTTK